MTKKQCNLLKEMYLVLDTEFDFGVIGKKKTYSSQEAFKLIGLNKDLFYLIIDEGQCTVRQYNELQKIAGRKLKKERHFLSFQQAAEWIKEYGKAVKV